MQLKDDIQFVKGIGPKRADIFYQSNINTVKDFLFLLPRTYLQHSHAKKIRELQEDEFVTVIGRVMSAGKAHGRKERFVVHVTDGSGIIQGVWFNFIKQVENKIKKGMTVALRGKVAFYAGFQIVHPEIEIISEDEKQVPQEFIIPIYPISEPFRKANLNNTSLRKLYESILEKLVINDEDDLLPNEIIKRQHFLNLNVAFKNMHFPESPSQATEALRRFKFEELFLLQLYLQLKKRHYETTNKGHVFEKVGDIFNAILANLPFELTDAQKKVIKEIRKDIKSTKPMNRLIQGDVGSGKTVVALLSMAFAADNNFQSVLMAPTEILAEQHYQNIIKFTAGTQIIVCLLTGSLTEKQKKLRYADIANGMVHIVVGTQALIQEKVNFNHLGLVIIDEQHRFGVMQRALLMEKGSNPHVLVMTATPIPRTMALTVYGDLDISIINELPKGRLPIKTVWKFDHVSNEIYSYIKQKVTDGDQVYIVYPLVEDSEKIDLKSAVESFSKLQTGVFQNIPMALLHGKMKGEEKESIMAAFKAGDTKILVSTTVIEVGVDVPNATIMLVENAERFGLSQMHQLRGRIGRGAKQSLCIFKTSHNVGADAKERMKIMCETNDGFKIAEEDMRLRGLGELFGTRQSGYSDFRIANLMTDGLILEEARNEAFQLLDSDPRLSKAEHKNIKDFIVENVQNRFGLIDIA
jgi:ATP-dependent DNA helicase RecG